MVHNLPVKRAGGGRGLFKFRVGVMSSVKTPYSKTCTVDPQLNEVPRYWENWFVKSRVCYFEVGFSYFTVT